MYFGAFLKGPWTGKTENGIGQFLPWENGIWATWNGIRSLAMGKQMGWEMGFVCHLYDPL